MSQGHESRQIAAGAEVATTLSTRIPLQIVGASPAHKRVLAARALVAAAKELAFPVSLEVRTYFGVVSVAVLRLYGRLLDSEVLTFHELAAAAGNGVLLTQTLRKVLADAPDILTPYDDKASKRAKVYKQAFDLWENEPASAIPGQGGPQQGPATHWTPLAMSRAREADARVKEYHRLFPKGDPDFHAKFEEAQWKFAEMKLLAP
jgi:hypothetical protein